MMFIVTLIALLIERFFDWSHLRNWSWFVKLQHVVAHRFTGMSPYLVMALSVLPVVFGVAIVGFILKGILYGLISLLFEIFVLLYCFGPRNLWADAFACINALVAGDTQIAADKLKSTFGITETMYAQSTHRHFLNDIFIEANQRIFAVVFWFVVLGPAGAVLYRCVALSGGLVQGPNLAQAVLDWVPVRIFTFIFALGGRFVQTITAWRKRILLGLSGNDLLLTECGAAALGDEHDGKVPEDGTAEKNAISLLDRTFIIVLVIVMVVMWSS